MFMGLILTIISVHVKFFCRGLSPLSSLRNGGADGSVDEKVVLSRGGDAGIIGAVSMEMASGG